MICCYVKINRQLSANSICWLILRLTRKKSLRHFYKITFTIVSCFIVLITRGQFAVTGTVYDSTKTIPVKGVIVKSTSGTSAITDSSGRYTIVSSDKDSLLFIYQNKPTLKFAVKHIPDIGNFDISLHVRVEEKYKTLKEVKVYGRSYRQDSIENREQYARIFNYEKPGVKLGTDNYTGVTGADLDELINVFRFKRNQRLKKLQARLLEQEQENYINYRFNRATVRRITRLEGKDLDAFMKEYRPDFEFTQRSSIAEFYQYILNASYQFKKEQLLKQKTQDSLLLRSE